MKLDVIIGYTIFAVLIGLIAGWIWYGNNIINESHGQDIDPNYFCINNISPVCRQLDQQQILDIIQEICEIDESYCVTGKFDENFEDN